MAPTMLIGIHCLRAIFGRLLLMSAFADVGSAILVQARTLFLLFLGGGWGILAAANSSQGPFLSISFVAASVAVIRCQRY